MASRTRLTATSARTREQLILAAERLFAERGLDNVSLRQINAGAGQRNSSAAHYHFGSKAALVDAISTYRMERVDGNRAELLDRLARAGSPASVRGLLEALVLPFVSEIDHTEGGHNYIRFWAQLFGHPTVDLRGMWRHQMDTSIGRVYRELHRALPDLPDLLFGSRFGLLWELVVNSLADRTRLYGGDPEQHAVQRDLYVSNLLDGLEALIRAPASAETLRLLAAAGANGNRP